MNKVILGAVAALVLSGCASRADIVSQRADIDDRKTVEINEDGEEIICRKDLATGSRVRYTKVCGTKAEWDSIDDANDEQMKSLTKTWTNNPGS